MRSKRNDVSEACSKYESWAHTVSLFGEVTETTFADHFMMEGTRSGATLSLIDVEGLRALAAVEGKGRMGPYCASKAAVKTLTESLAAENKFDNINVNCILPGTIDTPQNRDAMPDANFSNWVPPEALADVVVFLASEAARCVTGAAIPVYGKS